MYLFHMLTLALEDFTVCVSLCWKTSLCAFPFKVVLNISKAYDVVEVYDRLHLHFQHCV